PKGYTWRGLTTASIAEHRTIAEQPATGGGLGRALLGLPLFLKVLVANVIVVLIGVGVGTWFTLTFVAGAAGTVHWAAVAVMLVVGFAASVLINAIVLTLALQPLHALERTVDRVAAGDLSARA